MSTLSLSKMVLISVDKVRYAAYLHELVSFALLPCKNFDDANTCWIATASARSMNALKCSVSALVVAH